ncbi:MAG TPA: inorganic phosphate transporter [Candidatus Eremiobacteraceae bacterium]|nr:inorganic phosphate transporter [Candidatus Eremiobacteraceae bacterium]
MVTALAFNVVAGFNDGGNLLAAAASSRTIPVPTAFVLIVVFAFVGPLVFGTAVAATLGTGIADYAKAGMPLLLAAIAASLAAVLLAYAMRLPTMMSLSLVSAMVGSLITGGDMHLVHWPGVVKVVASAFGSGLAGFVMGALAFALLRLLLRPVSRATGDRLMNLQYGTVALQALGYGANDAEKMMGLMAAAVAPQIAGQAFHVPLWAIGAAIAAFGGGLAVGGMRVAKTVGGKLFTIRPEHALAFQAAAGATVMGASFVGAPLSTTETTASAIVGVGAVARPRRVHWQVVAKLIGAWLITMPVAFALGTLAGLVVRWVK